MKAIFITYDQAHHEDVTRILGNNNCRGFSYLEQVQGKGTNTGIPHYGNHAWPGMCSAIITMVNDNQVEPVLQALRQLDLSCEQLGLRAFVWNIEKSI